MPCGRHGCPDCIEEGDQESNNKQTGPRKKRKYVWRINAAGAPITKRSGELLSQLLLIFGRSQRAALDSLQAGPPTPETIEKTPVDPSDILSLVNSLKRQTEDLQRSELKYMLTRVQLVLNVDR
jgi:hypothetical protein